MQLTWYELAGMDAYETTKFFERGFMKFYLSAKYVRNSEMRGYRSQLEQLGHTITSRWIDCHEGRYPIPFNPHTVDDHLEDCAKLANDDLMDIQAADIVIAFTDVASGGTGGRHIEFGYALAYEIPVVVVGPRENVFHALPEIEWYPDWESLLKAWAD
jgi:nucleoside 2-deoxyribosyltransferase